MTIPATNKALYDALKALLPGIPDGAQKLTLALEYDKPPVLTVQYIPRTDGEIKLPVEFKVEAFKIVPINDGLVDVTTIGDEDRRFVNADPGP